ncbi:hypothetical protein JCM4914_11400 [Streptomyces platensis subsp. malvinus]
MQEHHLPTTAAPARGRCQVPEGRSQAVTPRARRHRAGRLRHPASRREADFMIAEPAAERAEFARRGAHPTVMRHGS